MNIGKIDGLVLAFQAFVIPCALFGIVGFGLGIGISIVGLLCLWLILVNMNIKLALTESRDQKSLGELLEFCYSYQNELMGLSSVSNRTAALMVIPVVLGVLNGTFWFGLFAVLSAAYLLLSDKTEQLTYDLIMENIE